jgi:drug/metabolite transporter (DMT)-like permease
MRPLLSPYALLTLASLFWAGNMVLARAMRHDIPPVAMSFWRWFIAALIVLPFVARELRDQWPVVRAAWKKFAVLGLVSVTFFNTLCYIGVQYTTATNAVLLNSTIPMLIVLISWAVLGERLSQRQTLAVALSLLGVVLIVAHGELATLASLQLNRGDLILLAAMVLWAAYTILLRWKPPELSPLAFLGCIILFGLPGLALIYAAELLSGTAFRPTTAAVATLAYYGVFPSVLSYLCFNRGVAVLGANTAGIFVHLMPVFGFLLSAVFLSEPPRWYHFAGMGLVFGGIWLFSTGRSRAPAAPAEL